MSKNKRKPVEDEPKLPEGFDAIRDAVEQRHGGFNKATDAAVLRLWRSLDDKTQKRYLNPETTDDRTGPESDNELQPEAGGGEAGG